MYLELNQQLLIYVRGKCEIKKSKIMKIKKKAFALLEKKSKLVISRLIRFSADKIGGSIIYTAIRVNTQVGKTHKVKVNI